MWGCDLDENVVNLILEVGVENIGGNVTRFPYLFTVTEKLRSKGGRTVQGVGVMKDTEVQVGEMKFLHTLGGEPGEVVFRLCVHHDG